MIYVRVFRHWLQAKYEWLSELLCVFDIIYAQHCIIRAILSEQYDMPDGLNYEYTHTQMSYILYLIKISKRPTLKGQCGLEGIVIKILLGINQFKDKLTSKLSISFHASFSRRMGTHWYNFLNKLLVIYERVFRHWLQAKYGCLN